MDAEYIERQADTAHYAATRLLQEQLIAAAVELVERYPRLREGPQGFSGRVEEFVTDFCREVGTVTEGQANEFLQRGRLG